MQLIDVIVLAGAVNKGKLRACSKAEYEAMIDINKINVSGICCRCVNKS